jgi:hypothetical protein
MERESGKLGQQKLAISNGVIGVALLKRPEICQEANSLVILFGTRLLKMAHGRSEQIVGRLYFQNQDNEWEEFPDEEALAHIRASAQILQDMGWAIICQGCNEHPTILQIKHRYMKQSWTCKCGVVNSAGRA